MRRKLNSVSQKQVTVYAKENKDKEKLVQSYDPRGGCGGIVPTIGKPVWWNILF